MTPSQILIIIVAIICSLFGALFAIAAVIEHNRSRKASTPDDRQTHRSTRNLIAIIAAIAILQAAADFTVVAL
ncbi:hypothetical protein C5E11_03970 [Clavibacter michiganensis]|nr:hypothetical protein [Clavibacter michiganensis]PPF64555.1 hypothetical protein C5E11_03970 [Clavibacter michiganensis]